MDMQKQEQLKKDLHKQLTSETQIKKTPEKNKQILEGVASQAVNDVLIRRSSMDLISK